VKRPPLSLAVPTRARPPIDPEAERRFLAGERLDVPAPERPAVVTPERQDQPTPLRQDATTPERHDVVTSQRQRWKPSKLRRDLTADQRERLTVWLPAELATRLRMAAADQRRAQADVVSAALDAYLTPKP
jgi:hypothetical protein